MKCIRVRFSMLFRDYRHGWRRYLLFSLLTSVFVLFSASVALAQTSATQPAGLELTVQAWANTFLGIVALANSIYAAFGHGRWLKVLQADMNQTKAQVFDLAVNTTPPTTRVPSSTGNPTPMQ